MAYALPKILPEPEGDPEERTCTIWYIRRELGRGDYGDTRLVNYVRKLVEEYDFPRPLPVLKGQRLTADVTIESRWIRKAVDHWLFDCLPPAAADALDEAARQAAGAEMDAAACNLRVVGGTQA